MKCDLCGVEEDLPFTCNYCAGTFCADHRLPEAHACKGDLTRRIVTSQPTYSWEGSVFSSSSRGRTPYIFSRTEVRDILIAWAALSLAFTIAQTSPGLFGGAALFGGDVVLLFFVSLIAVGSGFVLHELMHKFTAERYGYWAEFRMWVAGVILALVTSVLGFIFAAPGATYIQGANVSEKEYGIISIAGPLTNIAIAVAFLLVGLVGIGGHLTAEIASIGFPINLFLALFNMLPLMPLDGAKVFRWNKAYWSAIFFPLLLIFVVLFFGL